VGVVGIRVDGYLRRPDGRRLNEIAVLLWGGVVRPPHYANAMVRLPEIQQFRA